MPPRGTSVKGASGAIGKSEILGLIKTQLEGTLVRAAASDTYTKGTDPTGPVDKYTKGTSSFNPGDVMINPGRNIRTRPGG
jgi:hypothetical protein